MSINEEIKDTTEIKDYEEIQEILNNETISAGSKFVLQELLVNEMTDLYKFLTYKSIFSPYQENLFHNLCWFGCIKTIKKCILSLGNNKKKRKDGKNIITDLLEQKDNEFSTPLMYAVSGTKQVIALKRIENYKEIVNLILKNHKESLKILNRTGLTPLKLCFQQTMVGNYIKLDELITEVNIVPLTTKENLSKDIQQMINNNRILLFELIKFCDDKQLDELQTMFSNIFNKNSYFNYTEKKTASERRHIIKMLEKAKLLDLEENDDLQFNNIMRDIDEIKSERKKIFLKKDEEARKIMEELLKQEEEEEIKKERKKEKKKEKKKSERGGGGGGGGSEIEKFEVKEFTGDILLKEKIEGVLTITCFSKRYNGTTTKELTLHGLWPRLNEKLIDNATVDSNLKIDISSFLDTYKNKYKNVTCFSDNKDYLKINEWKKHGIFANKYKTINEYINESCDLATPILSFLVHRGDIIGSEYSFVDMVKDIKESQFGKFFKKEVDNENYQEIQFYVCGIKINDSDEKFEWRFYSPSKTDGTILRKKNKKRSLKSFKIILRRKKF